MLDYLVTGSYGTQAVYTVRSEQAAAARFESEFPDQQVTTCRAVSSWQALDAVNRIEMRLSDAHEDGDDCEWCAEGIPH